MSGIRGRKGFLPTPHTEMHRYAIENGLTSTKIARETGIHRVTVRRHFLGWGISAPYSVIYRSHWPDMPVPRKGRPQWFEHPLPIRRLPLPEAQDSHQAVEPSGPTQSGNLGGTQ